MKNKSLIYILAGALSGITVYLLARSLKAGKRKNDLQMEKALKEKFRKKFAHEYGEYTL